MEFNHSKICLCYYKLRPTCAIVKERLWIFQTPVSRIDVSI
jgi:hypothetical protein